MDFIIPEETNDAILQDSNVTENDAPLWSVAETYTLNQIRLYVADNIHWVVKSLTNGNIGNVPTGLDTDLNWQFLYVSNRFKMFDLSTGSQTINTNLIDVTMIGTSIVDSAGLLNIDGNTAQLIGRDSDGIEFFNETKDLISTNGIYDEYTYFFSPIIKDTDVLFTGIPPYTLATYQVIITADGDAKCGTCLIGKLNSAGGTEYGMSVGISDYSIKSANEFGEFTITERRYSKEMSLSAFLPKQDADSLANTLNKYRSKPLIYIGADEYKLSFIYGFYKDYRIVVSYPTHCKANFDITGLS